MRIAVIGCVDSMYHDGPRIAKAFERKGHYVQLHSLTTDPQQTVQAIKEFAPTFCLVTIGRGYDASALVAMKSSTILVHWAYDEYTPEKDSLYKDYKDVYDITFVKAKGLVPRLKDYCEHAEFMPMFFDQIHDGINQNIMPDIAITFMGEPHPVQSTIRQTYLKNLSDDGYKVNVIGYYWEKFMEGMDSIFMGGAVGPYASLLLARSKICLNFENDLLEQVELGFSDRVLKIMGAGSLCVTHAIPGIEQLFEPKKHLVTYSGYRELKEVIDYYLKNPEERKQIADAGQEKVLKEYNIDVITDKYIEKILEIFPAHKPEE